jgi:phospholipid/cholesterol/gamma-HCH transport system permease protein
VSVGVSGEVGARERSGSLGVSAMGVVPSGTRRVIVDVGEIAQLLSRLVVGVFRDPRGFWAATVDEMYGMLRFCWLAVALAVGGFTLAIGTFAYDLLRVAGAPNRVGTFFVMACPREISPFCTGMAVAGVMGTALTADLGARRVREELDALEVLGVDPERMLVLPRVLAMVVMVFGFNIVGVVIGTFMAGVATFWIGDTSAGAYIANFMSIMNMPDLVGTALKSILLGLFIGVVCAQKGMSAKGGAEGVGRAVNQAVVLCFAAIWVINFTFNTILLGMNPSMAVTR